MSAVPDMKLEVVVIPVSDVDRAKDFYVEPRVEARRRRRPAWSSSRRPGPGARCSSARTSRRPSPVRPRATTWSSPTSRRPGPSWSRAGVEVSEVFHIGPEGPVPRCWIPSAEATARAPSSATPTATAGWFQEITTRLPGRVDAAPRRRSRPSPTWRARCGARRPPTASTRSAPGSATRTGPTGTPRTWWRSRPGRSSRRERRLRRDRPRRRRARRALRRRAGRGRPARRRRRARAGRRRVLLLGVHPVQDAAAPGRGGAGRARGGASAQVDVEAALAWRDFMVSNYSDAGQERWLADRGIDLLRGTGRLAGTGRRRGRRRPPHRRARRRRDRRGSDRPAGPRPARARGRLDHPRGDEHEGGPAPPARPGRRAGRRRAGPGRAPPRRRGGARRGRRARARPRARAARRGARRGPAPRRHRAPRSACTPPRRGATATTTSWSSTDGRELRGDRLLVATGRRPRVEGIGLETVGVEADPHGIPVDEHLRAGERLWAIGDVTGIWPLTHVGEYEGDVVAANILGEPRPANYEAVPRVTYTDPAGRGGRRDRGAVQRHRAPSSEVPKTADLHARLRRVQRLPDAAQRRRAADRRLRARPRGRRVAAAGDAGHPRPRPARRAARHDPAVPDLLRDLRRRAQGAARGDRRQPRPVRPWTRRWRACRD